MRGRPRRRKYSKTQANTYTCTHTHTNRCPGAQTHTRTHVCLAGKTFIGACTRMYPDTAEPTILDEASGGADEVCAGMGTTARRWGTGGSAKSSLDSRDKHKQQL